VLEGVERDGVGREECWDVDVEAAYVLLDFVAQVLPIKQVWEASETCARQRPGE
jgi:hypothetical protein